MVSFGQNSIGTASDIAKNKYQSSPDLEDAALYSDLRKSVGEKPRGWRAGVAGLLRGMEHGSKLKASEKFNKEMDYLESVNNSLIEQNQWHQKQEFAKQKALPQILSYIDNVNKLDPMSRNIMLQGILDQYNQDSGNDYKLKSQDALNPFLITMGSKNGEKTNDLRNLFMSDEILQQRMAMKTPEYLEKMQQERQDKERAFAIQEKNANSYAVGQSNIGQTKKSSQMINNNSGNNFEFNGNTYDTVPLNNLEKGEKTDYGKTVNKSVSQIPINEQALRSINIMREIFEKNPNIGSAFVNMLDSEDENSFSTWIGKNLMSKQEQADMEILKKASGDLNLSTVLSVPGKSATDLLKRTIKAASPTGKLTKIGFDKIADEWEQRAYANIEMAKAQAKGREQGKMIISLINQNQKIQQQDNDMWDQIGTPIQ